MFNEKTLSFFNADGSDYDFSAVDVEIGVKRNRGDDDFVTLTEGDGISITDNDVHFAFTEAQSATFKERPYYWQFRRTIDSKTKVWLNGAHDWHNGKFDAFNDSGDTVTITENGEVINIVINEAGVSVDATSSVKGIAKLYNDLNNSYTDGAVTQAVVKTLADSQGINVEANGVVADGVTIVTDELQAIIDDNVGDKIIIGSDPSKIFLIDKDINIPAGSVIELNGEIKSSAGLTRSLTADLVEGVNVLQVANASTYFKVGQKIVVTADDQPIIGGGAWKTQKVGSTNIITGVTDTTITCLRTFSELSNNQMLVSQNARVAKANSGFVLDQSHGTIIFGNGIINGNKANQLNVAPNRCDVIGEDISASCGLAIGRSDGVLIAGALKIKDWALHGVSTALDVSTTTSCKDLRLMNITIEGIMSKSILGMNLFDSTIKGCIAKDGVEEGDIILYNGCSNVLIDDCLAKGNRRYGIAVIGVDNKNIMVSNCKVVSHKLNPMVYNFYFQNQINGIVVNNIEATAAEMDLASWARSGTTCTVTTTVPHLLTNGQSIYVTVPGDVTTIPVGYKTITVTGASTFTFTCNNTGSTTSATFKYIGSVTDGGIIINSCKYVRAKNMQIWRHKLVSTSFSVTAGTPVLTTGFDINAEINITDGNNLATARAISISQTDRAILKVSVEGCNRVFNDLTGNTNILVKDSTITGATSLFENNNNSIRFSNVKGQYIFEASATETIAASDSTYFVNHGLNVTPRIEDIIIKPLNTGFDGDDLIVVPASINARNFKVMRVNGSSVGTAGVFQWEVKTNITNLLGTKTYSNNYSSDFSAGADGWTGTRAVVDGNIDGISDGTTSFDDTLRVYATADNNTHEFSKVVAVNAKYNKFRLYYYIPSGQTRVNGFRAYANVFGLTILEITSTNAVVGTWTEVSSADFLASSTTIIIRLMNTFATSFVGANSPTDDRIYFKFVKDDNLP